MPYLLLNLASWRLPISPSEQFRTCRSCPVAHSLLKMALFSRLGIYPAQSDVDRATNSLQKLLQPPNYDNKNAATTFKLRELTFLSLNR